MAMASNEYLVVLDLTKLLEKDVAATISIMMYWTIVTAVPPQNDEGSTGLKVRLHCSMFTAYFWNGKIAE